ncbi:isocitrate lyase/PEP mutase family protein [Deminuibacter soli]|uniref:Isocitrate lyase/phosphoenolpyruvate mutase family protein n=1 Tax=Deminuibacter soli TaxID=2291815 RepID=A0A3E1NI89_9BACT|nr:isocitrate lyase/phosphoenolpyruvate mutase family protein [Deminuibacter soli]RFM27640.1 isocitrate lyase/phosphoenolpyruvate mutase family protein [Deminuibacter soli]
MNQYSLFEQLHKQPHPFVIGNAWNAHSAKLFAQNGYQAIATSSGAVANTLGYGDGEAISFNDLLFVVKHIVQSVTLPVSVDMERGYGSSVTGIVHNLQQLHELGVAGINLEDSTNEKTLDDCTAFAYKLSDIRNRLEKQNIPLYINARTDAFLVDHPDALAITLERAKVYESAGASGLFVPFTTNIHHIQAITAATTLPVNVLYNAAMPSFAELTAAGVKRISLGMSAFRATYAHAATWMQQIKTTYTP